MSQIKIYYRGDKEVEENYTLKTIIFEVNKDGVAVASFNQPLKLNPLTTDFVLELFLIIEHVKRDDQIKVIIWTGKGRAFSAGASFGAKNKADKTLIEGYKKHGAGLMSEVGDDVVLKGLVMAMLRFPKISICAVNGMAVGGSANFALAGLHDLVYAAESAKFKYPFCSLGITPEVFSSYMIPRAMGLVVAKELFFTGRWFSSMEAKKYGLVNEVIPDDEFMKKVMAVATKLASSSQSSLRLTKRVINAHVLKPNGANEIMDEENRTINEAMKSPDFKKAIAAFMRKHAKSRKRTKKKSKL